MALRYQLIETLINRVKRPNFWFELAIVTLFLLSFAPVSYWFAEKYFIRNTHIAFFNHFKFGDHFTLSI